MSKPVLFLLLSAAMGFGSGLPFAPFIGGILGLAFGSVYSLCEWIAAKNQTKPPIEFPDPTRDSN